MTTLFNGILKSTFFSFLSLFVLSFFFIGCSATEDTTPEEEGTEITHNGVTYNTVTSPYTSRVWLDRNLGATQVCTSFDDEACYGDYYQWGREADGHEKNTSIGVELLANQISGIGNKFRYGASAELDWVESGVDDNGSLRSADWSKTDGSSICPVNFRLPTIDELSAETIDLALLNRDELYDSFLKIPAAGYRGMNVIIDKGGIVYLWSSTPTNYSAYLINAGSGYIHELAHHRGSGNAVRCIQNISSTPNQAPTADAGDDVNITLGESVTLSGSASGDSDGTISSYLWQENSVTVGTDENLTLSGLAVGTYTYTLVVTDDGESSSADSVVVTVAAVSTLITYNGLTYEEITSPYTGRVWLDRNLGALQVCTTIDDSDCYGDYYQWGRVADGHEKYNSETTDTKQSDQFITNGKFVIDNIDWLDSGIDNDGSSRMNSWARSNGGGVCPALFRVPTKDEFSAEAMTNNTINEQGVSMLSVDSFFKFADSGVRFAQTGAIELTGSKIWTNSQYDIGYSYYFSWYGRNSSDNEFDNAVGMPIRCIKVVQDNLNQAPTADAGDDVNITLGESVTLSGSASGDSDGTISSYLWQENSVTVGTDENLTLSGLAVGTYTYTLVVTDDDGESSSADSVVVTVSEESALNVGLYATGQTTSIQAFDDGSYKKGLVKTYTRGSDIVEDSALNIEWQDNNSTPQVNYSDAILICNNLTLGGYTDWRLPTIYELITIVDISRGTNLIPAINNTFVNIAIPNGLSWAYWSSTEHKVVTDTVFNLNFNHGYVDAGGIGANMFVKCVRDTQ